MEGVEEGFASMVVFGALPVVTSSSVLDAPVNLLTGKQQGRKERYGGATTWTDMAEEEVGGRWTASQGFSRYSRLDE